jgi:hypothetical protein
MFYFVIGIHWEKKKRGEGGWIACILVRSS